MNGYIRANKLSSHLASKRALRLCPWTTQDIRNVAVELVWRDHSSPSLDARAAVPLPPGTLLCQALLLPRNDAEEILVSVGPACLEAVHQSQQKGTPCTSRIPMLEVLSSTLNSLQQLFAAPVFWTSMIHSMDNR